MTKIQSLYNKSQHILLTLLPHTHFILKFIYYTGNIEKNEHKDIIYKFIVTTLHTKKN